MRCKISKIPLGVGIYQHIQNLKFLDRVAFCSRTILLALTTLIFFPPVFSLIDTTAAPTPSITTLTLSTSDISVEIAPGNSAGTFVASDPATISVTTNNYSGYTLGITANNNTDNTKLINTSDNTAYLTSISSASAPADFNANNWGYLPSKLNGVANSSYQPAPTTAATTLEATNAANPTANEYTIALGAKADYTLPEGTYENTFTITAVANPVNYSITYDKNTEDTVENMPSTQSGDTTDASVNIPNIVPQRAKYNFLGWCTSTPTTTNYIDSCSTDIYQPGGSANLNLTTTNSITLKAMWQKVVFTQTTQIRYQNADGTYGAYSTVDTKDVQSGATYSWSTSQISGFSTATYKSNSTSYTVTEDKTNQLSIDRQTYVLTVDKNASYISSVTGAGTYRAGQIVSISATPSAGNKFTSWSQTAGTTSSFANASATSTTFAMPASAATIYANGSRYYMQNITSGTCPTSRTLTHDSRDDKAYYIQKIGSTCWMTTNLNIAGGTTLYTSTSNIGRNYTLPSSSINGFSDDNTAYVYNTSTYGGYYSYAAATAGYNPTSGDSTYDICPKNWRLPTVAEYNNLRSTYDSGAKLAASPFYGTYSGACQYSSCFYSGSSSFYRTAAASGTGAYYMSTNANTTSMDYNSKNFGLNVRCVAK